MTTTIPEPVASTGGPVADWITLDDLNRDPFPIYERLRRESPVAYVPAAGHWFVTTYADVHTTHEDPATFTADERLPHEAVGGPLHAAQGRPRARGPARRRRRHPQAARDPRDLNRGLRPHLRDVLRAVRRQGPGADLMDDLAAPCTAENLRQIFGFENATAEDMLRWSQTMINGTGNDADDPDVWAAALRSSQELDAALDETHRARAPRARRLPDLAHRAARRRRGDPRGHAGEPQDVHRGRHQRAPRRDDQRRPRPPGR